MLISEVRVKGRARTKVETYSNRIMTVKDVAEYLRVHSSTVRRQLKGGQFPAFKVGSDWRFKIESIDRWCLDKESAFMGAGDEKKLKLVRKDASAPLGS
jgi:excisionase family DNA binding protein